MKEDLLQEKKVNEFIKMFDKTGNTDELIKKLNNFTINHIDDKEHNLVVDVEIKIMGDEKCWNGYDVGSSHSPMVYIPIHFWYIENGVKDQENYYNDNNLAAIIIKGDKVFWTNDIEEAYYNNRLFEINLNTIIENFFIAK